MYLNDNSTEMHGADAVSPEVQEALKAKGRHQTISFAVLVVTGATLTMFAAFTTVSVPFWDALKLIGVVVGLLLMVLAGMRIQRAALLLETHS